MCETGHSTLSLLIDFFYIFVLVNETADSKRLRRKLNNEYDTFSTNACVP
jgi:hypothetical protein